MATRNRPPSATSFPRTLARYSGAVEAALRSTIPGGDIPLHRAMRYHMGWSDEGGAPVAGAGGKRLRPILCLMTCKAVGGSPRQAMPAAAALELVHNFSLVHDDVQDQDRERHQRPTVWALWGEPQALMVGNTLYALACKSVLGLAYHRIATTLVLRSLERLVKSSLAMLEGQYLDLEFERRLDVTTQEYLDMIALKTGALMSCAMELGCLIGSGDPAKVPPFARSGLFIGQLFQLRDDILGIWGDSAFTGKAVYADLHRRKKTYPVIHAFQHASSVGAATLRRVYQKDHLDGDDIRLVLEVLESTGACQEAQRQAASLADQALESIRPAELPPPSSRELEELVFFLLYRER